MRRNAVRPVLSQKADKLSSKAEDDMDTLLRHWHMLRLVPRHPRKISTAVLEDKLSEAGYPTTRRTIQRDLDKLSREFPLLTDGNKPSGWSWQAEAELFDVPGMDTTAALTFKMVESFLQHMMPKGCLSAISPHLKQAAKILDQLEGTSLQSWPDKVRTLHRTQPLIPAEVSTEVIDTVYAALFHDRQFIGDYHSRGESETKEFVVNPLGLVFTDPVIYLVATLWNYEDVRTLALHRFETARLLEDGLKRPKDFSLDSYLDAGALGIPHKESPGNIKLKFRMAKYIAQHLEESPLSDDQSIKRSGDKNVVVGATVLDTHQLRWWLLGFGPNIEVLKPDSLRDEIAESHKQASQVYD